MAKQTITNNLSTSIGGKAMQEIRKKGLAPITEKQALDIKGVEAVYTGEAKKSIDPFINIEDNYAKYIGRTPRILFQEQEEQLRELRAENQTYGEIIRRGVAKTVGKTLIHAVGGLSSIVSTGFAAITTPVVALAKGKEAAGEFFESLYDNAYYKALDKGVEKLDEIMPIYETKAVQQAGELSWKKLTSAKSIVDDLFGGLSFLVGAFIGGLGVGAAAKSFAFTAKLMSKAKKIGKVLSADDLAGLAVKGARKEALTALAGQVLLSGYESGIQARQFKDMAIEEYRKKYIDENNKLPTDEEMAKFDDELTSVSNGVFAVNFGMVTMENFIMLNKVFGSPLKKYIPKGMKQKQNLLPPPRYAHVLKQIGKTLYKPVFEGSQEFAQELVNRAATEFIMAKYSPEGLDQNIGFFDYYGETLKEMYGDDTAWKEAYIGALMGLIGIPFVATGSVTEIPKIFKKPKASEFAAKYHKYDTGNVMKNSAANLARIYELTQSKENAIANGSMLEAKDKENEEMLSWMNSRDNVGLLDEEIDTYLDTLEKMTDDEFKEQFEYDGITPNEIKERKKQLAENLRQQHKNFIAAKNTANQIVDPTASENEAGDLNEKITYILFMNKSAQDRIDRITNEIEQSTGLKVDKPVLSKKDQQRLEKEGVSSDFSDGSLMSFFDEKGNLKKNAPDSLKKYLKDPNNYIDLFNALKDRAILTKRQDSYAGLIQKMYNVEFQAKLIDEIKETKFRMFDKFVNGVESIEKYRGYVTELGVMKQKLEQELANTTDQDKKDQINDDIKKVETRINSINKILNRRAKVKDEMILLAKVIKLNLLDPQREEYGQRINKVKIKTDLSGVVIPLDSDIGKMQNIYAVYKYGDSNPLDINIEEDQELRVYGIDEEGRPLLFTLVTYLGDGLSEIEYSKVKYDDKGVLIKEKLTYDDAIFITGGKEIEGLMREDFVSIDGAISNVNALNETVFYFTALNDKRVETKSSVRVNTAIGKNYSYNQIAQRLLDFAESNNKLNERKALLNIELKEVEDEEGNKQKVKVVNPLTLISTSLIAPNSDKYNYEFLPSEKDTGNIVMDEDGVFIVKVKATAKPGVDLEGEIEEDTFDIIIPTTDFSVQGDTEKAKELREKVKELQDKLKNGLNVVNNVPNYLPGMQIDGFTIGDQAIQLVNGKYELISGIEIENVDIENAIKDNLIVYIGRLISRAEYDAAGNMTKKPIFSGVEASTKAEAVNYIYDKYKEIEEDKNALKTKVSIRFGNQIHDLVKEYIKDVYKRDEGSDFALRFKTYADFFDDTNEVTQEDLLKEISEITEREKQRAIDNFGLDKKREIFNSLTSMFSENLVLLENIDEESANKLYENMRNMSRLIGNLEYNFALGVKKTDNDQSSIDVIKENILEVYNALGLFVDPDHVPVTDLNYDIKSVSGTFEGRSNIERRRQEVERISKLPFGERIPALKKAGIIISNITYNLGKRFPVIVDIAGVKVAFYRSSEGTGGKQKGDWTPMFGFGKDKAGNEWLIKGDIDTQVNANYNSAAIKEYTDILNKTLNWDHSLDKGQVKNHPFFKELELAESEQAFNQELYGVRDLGIINRETNVSGFINSKLQEINAKYDAELAALNQQQSSGSKYTRDSDNIVVDNTVAYQDGRLINPDLVDVILLENADDNIQTVFVNRVLSPEFLYEDGVGGPPAIVESIEFTEDQIDDIVKNPDKYKKTYIDIINERYKKPPYNPPGEEEGEFKYGATKGFYQTEGLDYHISKQGRLIPESSDFLGKMELFLLTGEATDSRKSKQHRSAVQSRTVSQRILNIWNSSDNEFIKQGFENAGEMIKASTKAIEEIAQLDPTAEIDPNTYGFIRVNSYNPYYTHKNPNNPSIGTYSKREASVFVDYKTEEAIFLVKYDKKNNRYIPIAKVPYYGKFVDENGVDLGPQPATITEDHREIYANKYFTVKKIWDNTGIDEVYFDSSISKIFLPQDIHAESTIGQMVKSEFVSEAYYLSGRTVYVYNKENNTWTQDTSRKNIGSLRKARLERGLTNSSLLFLKIGDKYEVLIPGTEITSTTSIAEHNANLNSIINLAREYMKGSSSVVTSDNYEDFSRRLMELKLFSTDQVTKKTRGEGKNEIVFFQLKTNSIKYPIKGDKNTNNYNISRLNNTIVIEKTLLRKEGKATQAYIRVLINKDSINYEYFDNTRKDENGNPYKKTITVNEGFDATKLLSILRDNTPEESRLKLNAEIKFDPKSLDSINTLRLKSAFSPSISISEGTEIYEQDPPKRRKIQRESIDDIQAATINNFTSFFRVNSDEEVEQFEKGIRGSNNKFTRVFKVEDKIYLQGESKVGDRVKKKYYEIDSFIEGNPVEVKDRNELNQISVFPTQSTIGYIPISNYNNTLYVYTKDGRIISLASGKEVFKDKSTKQAQTIIGDVENAFEYGKTILVTPAPNQTFTESPFEEEIIVEEQETQEQETQEQKSNDPLNKGTTKQKIQEDDDDAPFATRPSDGNQYSQQDISKAKQNLAKIVPFQVEQMAEGLQNMLNDGTAVGAFHKNVIYLLDESEQYHEAFHGVFRTLMSVEEVNTVMSMAKRKYSAPTTKDIDNLRNLTEHNKTLTSQQLIDLYYEEKLAEDFQQYMKTGESFFQRFWRKILDFIRTFMSKEQDIYTVFREIEKGKYLQSIPRSTAPYAFRSPAYAVLKVARADNNDRIYAYNMGSNQVKDVVGMVAYHVFKNVPNLEEISDDDFMRAIAESRKQFNPEEWFAYLYNNNVPGIHAKMNLIVDYYNSLIYPGENMLIYSVDVETNNATILEVESTDEKYAINNNDQIINDAKKLLKFYSGEVYDEVEENEESEEDNGEPDEMVRKDSNRYGGLKSESKAFRLFIGLTTYDKNLFNIKGVSEDKTVNMPIKAEIVYSKIKRLLSNNKKNDFISIIKFAAKDDVEIRAFYNRMMAEINKELSIDSSNDYLENELSVNEYVNSPTWNLMAKTFYQTSTDYLHIRSTYSEAGKQTISYFPNRFGQSNNIYKNWVASYNRLDLDKDQTAKNLEIVLEKMTTLEEMSLSDPLFDPSMDDFVKSIQSLLGIKINKAYLRYNLSINKTNEVSTMQALGVETLNTGVIIDLINNVEASESGNLFTIDNESILRRIASGVNYFDESNTSFVLTNPEGEKIYTSIYNSYDTELFGLFKNSFSDGEFDILLLRENLEALSYPNDIIDRYIEMAKYNYLFMQKDLTPDDFSIIMSFGRDNTSYDKLNQVGKDKYKIEAYLSTPGQIDANSRRLFNPFIIAEKNTNKLFKFEVLPYSARYDKGEIIIKDNVLNIFVDFLNIELASLRQYEDDVRKLIAGEKIESLVAEYHYNEYPVDGKLVKVVYIDGKYYALKEIWDDTTYKTHKILEGYNVEEIEKPNGYKDPKGIKLFQFENIRQQWARSRNNPEAVKKLVKTWLKEKIQKEIDDMYISNLMMNIQNETITSVSKKETDPSKFLNKAIDFLVNDMTASMSIQYALYGGSPIYIHKDFKDVTKRNSGVNANGTGIGNSKTKVAISKANIQRITDPAILENTPDAKIDTQDGQNYATALWYFSKYAKYKSVVGIKDIALKVVAGISLTNEEIDTLAKNNMLLVDRKIVGKNTFLYDKTSVHIQSREAVSIPLVSDGALLLAWKEYLKNPNPEDYNRIIYPLYKAKSGFEYHHDMLNSMEAQGIHIHIIDSASKNASINVANNVKELQPFEVDDVFIKEQVKTDNIKKSIVDPTQSMALLWSEQSDEFQVYADKYLEIMSYRVLKSNNYQINKFFPDGKVNYELIWDMIKDNISVNDPQLYELLSVENGIPKYNWNLPNVNARVLAAFMASISKNGLKQKVKGSKLNLVSSYGYGPELNWKFELEEYPGIYFSEVYVTKRFLETNNLKVGDIMWGTRIPTEDKYSMANLYIKGVIEGPYANSIFLPKEIMNISGADFDLDSLYVKIMSTSIGRQMFRDIYNKDVTARELIDKYVENRKTKVKILGKEVEKDLTPDEEVDTLNDILLFLSVILTHNSGNESIYASGNTLEPLMNSSVKPIEIEIESTSHFYDRSIAENSNALSKNGIGSSAVFNLAYQVAHKYFSKTFPLRFSYEDEILRINKYTSTHITAMADDPKYLLMSKYGLNGDNINYVIMFMSLFNMPYDKAITAVRDYSSITTRDRVEFLKDLNDKRSKMTEDQFKDYLNDYINDGYTISMNEKGEVVDFFIEELKDYSADDIFKMIKNTNSFFRTLGTIIRLNRKMPSTAREYYMLENSLRFSNIEFDRRYHPKDTMKYDKAMIVLGKNNYVVKGDTIYVKKVDEVVEISMRHIPGATVKVHEQMILDIIKKDEVVKQNIAAYVAYSEFNRDAFIKFKPLFRMLHRTVNEMLKEQKNDIVFNMNNFINDYDIDNMMKNSEEFIMASLNAMAYVDQNQPIYYGVLNESLPDGKGYMEALTKKILTSGEYIRLLYDTKYNKSESGKHIAILATANDESGEIRLEYTNDYTNMYNASKNFKVFNEFVQAEDKQAYIDKMNINDAKLLMSLFIFQYAMAKDAMMYTATSFSKIIDPRLFVKYGKATATINDAFKSFTSFKKYYGTENTNNQMQNIATRIFNSMIVYISNSSGEKTFPILNGYNIEAIKPAPISFAYAAPGLGKTTLARKYPDQYVDLDAVVDEVVLSHRKLTDRNAVSLGPAKNSLILNKNDQYARSVREGLGLTNDDLNIIINKIRNEISKYEGKTVLSAYDDVKMRGIGYEYGKYYIPSDKSVRTILDRLYNREENPISKNDLDFEKYIKMYIYTYASRNNTVTISDNLEATLNSIDYHEYVKQVGSTMSITWNGVEYNLVGTGSELKIFDKDLNEVFGLKPEEITRLEFNALHKSGGATKFNDYLISNDGRVYFIREKKLLSKNDAKQIIDEYKKFQAGNIQFSNTAIGVVFKTSRSTKENEYVVDGDKIYFKGKEVFKTDSDDRRAILGIRDLEIKDAVLVDNQYIYYDENNILYLKNGKKVTGLSNFEKAEIVKSGKEKFELIRTQESEVEREYTKNTVKVVSDAYGVIVAETNPSDVETKHFLELIKPQIQAQATKENIGKNANLMFQYGLRWARVELSANPLSINAPNKSASSRDSEIEKLKKAGKNKTSSFIYAYHTLDQNGNLLPPISTLNPIIEKIQNTIGIDMSNYDAVIGNIYLPGQNISTHRDVTESESARNYPVIVYTIGAGNAINIYENKENPGKTSFASDSKIEIPTKNGTIYTFGLDGKGRFEMAHDTPKAIQKGETLEPIILPDGTVVKDYTITLTFRRAQDLEQGMDVSPKRINLKETTQQQQPESRNISYYEGDIKPDPNTIFVFGSNPEGRHGKGSAKVAMDQFGAIYGQGEGLQGNAYALPTKDLRVKENNSLKSISFNQIVNNIQKLYEVAKQNPDKQFKVAYRNTTEKSLNGYTGLEMIEMFKQAGKIPSNIIFSKEWFDTGKMKQAQQPAVKSSEIYSQLGGQTSRGNVKIDEVAGRKPAREINEVSKISVPIKSSKKIQYTLYNEASNRNIIKNGYKITIPEFPDVELYLTNENITQDSNENDPKFNAISKEWFIEINTKDRGALIISTPSASTQKEVLEKLAEEINEKHSKSEEALNILKSVGIDLTRKQSSKPIVAYRTKGNNFLEALEKDNAIGNPWNSRGFSLYKTKSVKESVEEFIAWMTGERHTDKLQDYRQAIIDKIPELQGKDIIYYKELNEPSHATALDYLINEYEFTQEENIFDSLELFWESQKNINEEYKEISFDDFKKTSDNAINSLYTKFKDKYSKEEITKRYLKKLHKQINNC